MKFKVQKHWRLIVIGGFFVVVGVAAAHKKASIDSFDNTEGRKKLSDFQLAEAQSGKAHTLTENEFADRKAQEAFSSQENKEAKPTPPTEVKTPQIANTASELPSARARAAELLGAPVPEPVATPSTRPLPTPETKSPEAEKVKATPQPKVRGSHPSPPSPRRVEEGEVSLASTRPMPRDAVPPPSHYGSAMGSGVYAKNPPSVMAKLDDSEVTETLGSRSTFVRGDLLKMGSIYLAKIDDAIDVRGSRTQDLNITVFGKSSAHTVNQPFILGGVAKLSEDGKTIDIEIKDCIASAPNAKAIPCAGEVKSLDGTNGLRNEIYSPSIWPSILNILGEAGSVYSLGRMTQSATELGVLMDQSQSNALWGAAGSAWKKTFEQAAERLERERDGGKAAGGAIVKVRIAKDTALW